MDNVDSVVRYIFLLAFTIKVTNAIYVFSFILDKFTYIKLKHITYYNALDKFSTLPIKQQSFLKKVLFEIYRRHNKFCAQTILCICDTGDFCVDKKYKNWNKIFDRKYFPF